LSLPSAERTAGANYLGHWGRTLRPLANLFPHLNDITLDSDLPAMTECKALLAEFSADRDFLGTRYQAWDKNYVDHDAAGAKTFQYHPKGLPSAKHFPTAAEFTNPDSKVSCATRPFVAVVNHKLWCEVYDQKQDDIDSAAMFLSQSQPGAGDAYNCLPGICPATNWSSSDLQTDLQRRLRVPLFPAAPAGHDEMGDSLQNAGEHTTRHNAALGPVADATIATYGSANVHVDPRDGSAVEWNVGHVSDIAALNKSPDGHHVVVDIKVANFTKSTYSMQDRRRGAILPFAATGDEYTVMVRGREALEQPAGTTASYNRRNHSGLRTAPQ